MSWQTLPQPVQAIAAETLTPKQLDVFKLYIAGCGYTRISQLLHTSRSNVRQHLDAAHLALHKAGVHRNDDGTYYLKDAA